MNFSFYSDDITGLSTDLVGLLCCENLLYGAAFAALDNALDGALGRMAQEERFKGKKGQTLLVHGHGRVGAKRILLVGGGLQSELQPPDLRLFAARAVKAALGTSSRQIALVMPELPAATMPSAAQHLAEGVVLGGYRFDKYVSDETRRNDTRVEECTVVVAKDAHEPLARALGRGEAVARGVIQARDLINEPAGYMTPRQMAAVAQDVAQRHGLELKVLGPKECAALGMGMYLAVAQGSEEEPRFIHLCYRPPVPASDVPGGRTPPKKVVLVGKGVTFDSGGLSLKTTSGMEMMKVDMAGAAAVISAIGVLATLRTPCEVHAIAACTENMPSGRAYKLGDVLRALSGKTVEINNTDAEGRLTLGDALAYAVREIKPDELFDFATLTGACVVALGPHTAGVMSNHTGLVDRWLEAARRAGEDMWPLPLRDRLKEQLKSEIADMKNTGDRSGGALTAGLFLKEFVGDTPWVHVDLAGPAAADKEHGHIAKGGTGFGVATIVEYLTGPVGG